MPTLCCTHFSLKRKFRERKLYNTSSLSFLFFINYAVFINYYKSHDLNLKAETKMNINTQLITESLLKIANIY